MSRTIRQALRERAARADRRAGRAFDDPRMHPGASVPGWMTRLDRPVACTHDFSPSGKCRACGRPWEA